MSAHPDIDMMSFTGSTRGGIAVAKGAALGAPFFPPVGSFVGGLAGGVGASALATGGGRFLGETAEDLVEGRSFNPEKAFKNGLDAAGTDALYSLGFGLGFPALGKVGSRIKEFAGGSSLPDEAIETIANLQLKLKEFGGSLMPTMVTDKRSASLLEDVAKVSEVTKRTVKNMFGKYQEYMGAQTEQLVNMYPKATSYQHGVNIQNLRNTANTALQEIVAPVYRIISEKGKIPVNLTEGISSQVSAIKRQVRGEPKLNPKTKKYEEVLNFVSGPQKQAFEYLSKLPRNLSFQEAHERLSTVKGRLNDITTSTDPDTAAAGIYRNTINILEQQMDSAASKLDPSLKKEYDGVTKAYREGMSVITTDYISKMMKVADPATIGRMITQDGLTVGIKDVRNLKKLAEEYRLKLPEDSKTRTALGLIEDPIEGIRRGYIEGLLRVDGGGGAGALKVLRDKLSQPQFKETFNVLFSGTPVPSKINKLFDELTILEKAEGSEAAFALSIRGQELGAARQAVEPSASTVSSIIKGFLPAFLAKKAISPAEIDRQIKLIEVATAAARQGKELPKAYYNSLGSLATGIKTGAVLGGLAGDQ